MEEAEISDVTWHTLGDTFAGRLVMKGVGLRAVQKLMGHKTIQMTCRYAHLGPEHQQLVVACLAPRPTGTEQPLESIIGCKLLKGL